MPVTATYSPTFNDLLYSRPSRRNSPPTQIQTTPVPFSDTRRPTFPTPRSPRDLRVSASKNLPPIAATPPPQETKRPQSHFRTLPAPPFQRRFSARPPFLPPSASKKL